MNAMNPIAVADLVAAGAKYEAEAPAMAKAVAERIWKLDRSIKDEQELLTDLKTKLVEYGHGVTYKLETGKVQVTEPSDGGPTGKFSYKFDETIFLSLPVEQQEQIKALGVVSLEAEVKRPYPATVKCLK